MEDVLVTCLVYDNTSRHREIVGRDQRPVYARMVNHVAADSHRTDGAALHLSRILERSARRCIVLSDRIAQLEALRTTLVVRGVDAGDVAYYIGRSTSAEREKAETKRVILSTYSMAREGLDIAVRRTLHSLTRDAARVASGLTVLSSRVAEARYTSHAVTGGRRGTGDRPDPAQAPR